MLLYIRTVSYCGIGAPQNHSYLSLPQLGLGRVAKRDGSKKKKSAVGSLLSHSDHVVNIAERKRAEKGRGNGRIRPVSY